MCLHAGGWDCVQFWNVPGVAEVHDQTGEWDTESVSIKDFSIRITEKSSIWHEINWYQYQLLLALFYMG